MHDDVMKLDVKESNSFFHFQMPTMPMQHMATMELMVIMELMVMMTPQSHQDPNVHRVSRNHFSEVAPDQKGLSFEQPFHGSCLRILRQVVLKVARSTRGHL